MWYVCDWAAYFHRFVPSDEAMINSVCVPWLILRMLQRLNSGKVKCFTFLSIHFTPLLHCMVGNDCLNCSSNYGKTRRYLMWRCSCDVRMWYGLVRWYWVLTKFYSVKSTKVDWRSVSLDVTRDNDSTVEHVAPNSVRAPFLDDRGKSEQSSPETERAVVCHALCGHWSQWPGHDGQRKSWPGLFLSWAKLIKHYLLLYASATCTWAVQI